MRPLDWSNRTKSPKDDMERNIWVPQEAERQSLVVELSEVRRTRLRVENAAYLWERLAEGRCNGSCAAPRVIAQVTRTHVLTCCEFYSAHVRVKELTGIERALQARLRLCA